MDFNLSEQEKMLQRLAKDFAIKAVPPYRQPFDIRRLFSNPSPPDSSQSPFLKGRCLDSHESGNDMGEKGGGLFRAKPAMVRGWLGWE